MAENIYEIRTSKGAQPNGVRVVQDFESMLGKNHLPEEERGFERARFCYDGGNIHVGVSYEEGKLMATLSGIPVITSPEDIEDASRLICARTGYLLWGERA